MSCASRFSAKAQRRKESPANASFASLRLCARNSSRHNALGKFCLKLPHRVLTFHDLLIGVCFVFSGATGLIYEVLWARMLGLVFGATTLAVSTVLAAFMGGLALGSALAGRLAPRIQETAEHLRLDGDRHRRLRVAGTVSVSLGRSSLCVDLATVSAGVFHVQSVAVCCCRV